MRCNIVTAPPSSTLYDYMSSLRTTVIYKCDGKRTMMYCIQHLHSRNIASATPMKLINNNVFVVHEYSRCTELLNFPIPRHSLWLQSLQLLVIFIPASFIIILILNSFQRHFLFGRTNILCYHIIPANSWVGSQASLVLPPLRSPNY